MREMILPNASTLLIGAECEHQSTVGYEAVFDALVNGASICALGETRGDFGVFQSHVTLWLRERERNPEHAERVFGLANHRRWYEPAALASEIAKLAKGRPKGSPLIVFNDLGQHILPLPVGHRWLRLAAEVPLHLDNASILTTAHTGSPMMPQPAVSTYVADRVWRIQCSGVAMNITATEIKPGHTTLRLKGGVSDGAIVLIDPQEEIEHV